MHKMEQSMLMLIKAQAFESIPSFFPSPSNLVFIQLPLLKNHWQEHYFQEQGVELFILQFKLPTPTLWKTFIDIVLTLCSSRIRGGNPTETQGLIELAQSCGTHRQ